MTIHLRITIPFEQDDYDSVYEALEKAFDKIGQDRDWLINATAEGVDGEIGDEDEDGLYSAYVYDPEHSQSDATTFDIIRFARKTGVIRSVEGYADGKTVAIVVGAYGEKAEAIAKFVEGL